MIPWSNLAYSGRISLVQHWLAGSRTLAPQFILLRATHCHCFWHLVWKYIWYVICSDIRLWHSLVTFDSGILLRLSVWHLFGHPILFGILSLFWHVIFLSGLLSDILADIYSEFLSGIVLALYMASYLTVYSGVLFGIYSIYSYILFCHSIWH